MADAVELGKKKVVTVGGLQSNHVRLTAAACAPLGIEAHIIHIAKKPEKMQGNQLLNHLLGAKIHYVPFGGGSVGSMTIETSSRLAKSLSTLLVGPGAYFIPVGGHTTTGCLGYVAAAFELHEQAVQLGMMDQPVTVVTAAGTGGTLAGLFAGFFLADSPIDVVGIDIGKLWKAFPESIANLVGELCDSFGEHHQFQAAGMPIIENTYDFKDDEHVIFLHTGGYPAVWAYEQTLAG
jgi:1-aminocyclopropane-1-carboxylate deaminase/D-cysteine desulfhydrase-like pyridoxal-dependent ACC family enzyme